MTRSETPTIRVKEHGAIVPMTVLGLAVLIIATALTVDIGRSTATNRDLQAVADLASLDAVRVMDGQAASLQQATVEAEANASAGRNDFGGEPGDTLIVELGHLAADGTFTVSGATDIPDAVRVEARRPLDYAFTAGGQTLHRDAIAVRSTVGGISIGSFLARLDLGESALNSYLGQQLGDLPNVTLLGYQGLAHAKLTLADLVAADLSVGTVDELLDADLTAAQFFSLMATALSANGTSTADIDAALAELQAAATTAGTFKLGDLLGITAGDGERFAALDLGVGDLVSATADIIGPDHLIDLDLALALPGVVDSSIKVAVIEGRQFALGKPRSADGPGVTVSTSQVRIYLDLELLPFLGSTVRLPLAVDVAPATAELVSISCGSDGSAATATAEVNTSAAQIRIGELTDAEVLSFAAPQPARLVQLPPLLFLPSVAVIGSSNTEVGDTTQMVPFMAPFDSSNIVSVGSFGLTGSVLLSDLLIELSPNLPLVSTLLTTVTELLDTVIAPALNVVVPLVDQITRLAGLKLGGADVSVFAAECQGPRLRR